MHVQGCTDVNTNWFGTDLFRLSLGPVVLSLFTYKHTVLGSVDQCVKWHKAHDAGQTETARINLHTNLKSDRWHMDKKNIQMLNNKICLGYRKKLIYTLFNISGFYVTVIMKEFMSSAKSYQVIFVTAFAFDISVATNCIQREVIREFTV